MNIGKDQYVPSIAGCTIEWSSLIFIDKKNMLTLLSIDYVQYFLFCSWDEIKTCFWSCTTTDNTWSKTFDTAHTHDSFTQPGRQSCPVMGNMSTLLVMKPRSGSECRNCCCGSVSCSRGTYRWLLRDWASNCCTAHGTSPAGSDSNKH